MALLALAPLHVVDVVAWQVRPVREPQVLVLIVVALDVERLVASAALRHAIVNKMLEGLVLVVVGPFSDIRIIL